MVNSESPSNSPAHEAAAAAADANRAVGVKHKTEDFRFVDVQSTPVQTDIDRILL